MAGLGPRRRDLDGLNCFSVEEDEADSLRGLIFCYTGAGTITL